MVLRITPEKRDERERVRLSLLRAALHLGAQHGFSSLGLREVARAASIAPTSFYRHFSDMPELGLALVEELVRPWIRELAARAVAAPQEQLASLLVDGMLNTLERDSELVSFLVGERFGPFAPLRRAIASELEQLGKAAPRGGKTRGRGAGPSLRSDALVALLLDGLGRALDVSPSRRPLLREQLILLLSDLLEDERTETRPR